VSADVRLLASVGIHDRDVGVTVALARERDQNRRLLG
jgi:hypothetical protein